VYFRVIFFNYLKNFLIIIFSLVAFFLFVDLMVNKNKIVDSINIQLLYIYYRSVSAMILIYPLALLLAVLTTIIGLVKKNEMIAFLSLGYSLKILLRPILFLSVGVTLFFILLQGLSNSSFAERCNAILNGKFFTNVNANLFFRFKDSVIFIKKLDIIHKTSYDMKVFHFKDRNLISVDDIKKAVFKKDVWSSNSITETILKENKIQKKEVKKEFLKGFKPDILNSLETKENINLHLAIETLLLLNKTDINVSFVKTYLYNAIIPPFSFILLIIIFFLKAPIHTRISNIPLFVLFSLLSAIFIWGLFLLIRKMSISSLISPDIAFLTPFIILFSFTIYYFRKI